MSSKKQSSSNSALIATIIVAALALAAVIVLLVVLNKNDGENSGENNFKATQELLDECGTSAHDLVSKNYEIIKLYITEGLAHKDEPYGNEPEDGIYTVDSDMYDSIDDIEELVKSVYTAEEADRILHNFELKLKDGSTQAVELYKNRDVFGDIFLGIDARFAPDTSYTADWSSCMLEVIPTSESSCDITVYINGITVEEAAEHPESVLSAKMIKTDDGWRLTEFLK